MLFSQELQCTELVRGDDSLPIYAVDQDLADHQTESETEVTGYYPQRNGAGWSAQYAADCHRCNVARGNEVSDM